MSTPARSAESGTPTTSSTFAATPATNNEQGGDGVLINDSDPKTTGGISGNENVERLVIDKFTYPHCVIQKPQT